MIIPAENYKAIYFTLLTIIVVFSCMRLFFLSKYIRLSANESKGLALVTLIFTVVYFGIRDPWGSPLYLGDTISYTQYFEELKFNVVTPTKDVGFYGFMKFFAAFTNITFFYLLCAFLYVFPQYLLSRKIAPNYFYYVFAVFVTSFSFFGFGTNGLRNGLATSLFLWALYIKPKTWKIILLLAIGYSVHSSLVLPIVAFAITYFFKRTGWLIGIWALTIPVSFFLGENMYLLFEDLLFFSEDRFNDLYNQNFRSNVIRAFRVDFLVYSAIPIALGAYFIYKKNFRDPFYVRIFNTYILANTAWLFFIYAAYTNRIAYLSWFLIPIILMYPLIKVPVWKNQSHVIAVVLLINLLLTLVLTL